MENLILPRMMGGLGNQLFIMAGTYAVQQAQSDRLIMIPDCVNPHSKTDYFCIFSNFPNTQKLYIPQEFLTGCIEFAYFAQINNMKYEAPQQTSYSRWDPTVVSVPCCLDGYFQYYPAIRPYFSDICKFIRAGLPNIPPKYDTGFIHVRRGDYLNLSHIHYIQEDEYYITGLQHFDTGKKFLIFSDDIEHCKQRKIFTELNAEFVEEPDEIRALSMMASCKGGAICANSTFSYWGAALSGAEKVIVPSRWSADIPEFLFPEHWKII